jgi:hypothetical protein
VIQGFAGSQRMIKLAKREKDEGFH